MVVADRRETLRWIARNALTDPHAFSRLVVRKPFYPHQQEASRAIFRAVEDPSLDDRQFTVMMSRQGGKNELSAQFEAFLLNRMQRADTRNQILKAAPTFKPQIVTSMMRLQAALGNWWNARRFKMRYGYIIMLGRAKVIFHTADPQANVVGSTADLLMEIDEAQDVDETIYRRSFEPMRAVANAPVVFYGTSWTSDSLLEKQKNHALDMQKRDGVRRHFEYPWTTIAEYNPAYGKFVQGRIEELGETHPIILTQYMLKSIDALGMLFGQAQLAAMHGEHSRRSGPRVPYQYVIGMDIAGSDEVEADDVLEHKVERRDSTVITVGELDWSDVDETHLLPRVRVVAHHWWTGDNLATQYQECLRIIRHWNPDAIVVDAGGVGRGMAEFLKYEIGGRVIYYVPNGPNKTKLGFELLAAVNTDRVKMYNEGEMSLVPEAKEFWKELKLAKREMYGNQQMRFFVSETDGHDDFVSSLALAVWASRYVSEAPQSVQMRIFRKGHFDAEDGHVDRAAKRSSDMRMVQR